ncbi:MAG: orotidine-5'-phosphate decarboxylase [Bacteroidales bacterium]|nr:orotidine-5'-phosphate decarboxylase [Bacteroidales bacterium]
MTSFELFQKIKQKQSFLCIGLDSDPKKIPSHLHSTEDPVFEFNKQIIDATHSYTVAYKPNIAFYESQGVEGWVSLQKTLDYLREIDAGLFVIADAKRGDIGNTSRMYARTFFESMDFDAVTVAPYMGKDSVEPFLGYDGKWVIMLALTSNAGADDFQFMEDKESKERLFEKVLKKGTEWGSVDKMMFVAGATRAEMLTDLRKIVPDHFLLVPGVGAQGGSLQEVSKYGMNKQCGLLVNSSRGIIFADSGNSFADVAGGKAREIQIEMAEILEKSGLI